MLSFNVVARNPSSNEKIKTQVQAENEQAAVKLIKDQGYAPIEITPAEGSSKGFGRFTNKVKTKDKILFSRQLSTLINAGLPLVQSLRNVSAQTTSKPLRLVVAEVIGEVEAGSAFSAALSKHPETFDNVFINLIAAGEASGTLDSALERLANQQEKDAEVLSKVRGAMVYPVIVFLVMIAVVTFMIVAVLPQVEVLYDGLPGASLPLLTRVLLAISNFIVNYWYIVLLVIAFLIFLTTRWARTFGGKRVIDKLKMKAWPVGPLFMKLYMARFSRTGTTLVASGIPLIQMLEITGKAVNNIFVKEALDRAIEKVRGGKALSASLAKEDAFLELVPNMLQIGEQSGSVEQMLAKTADYYEKEVDNQIKTISTIIEPVMMVTLGVVALIIVAAVLLPVYGLAGQGVLG